MALWSGRFTEGADAFTQRFGASLPVDQRLYAEDIAGSIAHANMLAAQGIIATADAEAIAEGLQGILADIDLRRAHVRRDGKRGHPHGHRGGADRAAWGMPGRGCTRAARATTRWQPTRACTPSVVPASLWPPTLPCARRSLPRPRRTSMSSCRATRTCSTPSRCCSRTICSPTCRCLRATGIASPPPATPPTHAPWGPRPWPGTTYPLDRFATAEALGFDHPIPNSLDAVSDRDFLLDLIYACSVSCLHLSRLCEEIVLWSIGGVRLHHAVGRLLHRLFHHAPEEEPRFRGAHPRQVGPRRGRSGGPHDDVEVAAARLQQGSAGGQGGRHGRRRHPGGLLRMRCRHDRHHDGERRRHGRPGEEGLSGRDGRGRLPGQEGPALPPRPRESWGIWCFCATSAAAIWKTSRWTTSRRKAISSNPTSWSA